jgi:hypothetical protein
MKILKYSLFLLAPLGHLSAAVNTFTGLTPDAPLTTAQPGWSLSEANSPTTPIAFVGVVGGSATGALGGDLGAITNPTGSAKLTMASSLTNQYVTVGLDLLITDSTNSDPARDAFGFSIANGSGATIVELSFLPLAQSLTPNSDLAQWQVSYLIAGSSTAISTFIINESVLNSINVVFANNNVGITLANNFDTVTFGGAVSGFNAAVNGVGNLAFNWTNSALSSGSNTMYFDNINVEAVPEPSSALLLSGAASLLLLKRRRA